VGRGRGRPRPVAFGVVTDNSEAAAAGRVVLVGTPIGNLGDLSPRAAEALRHATVVLCEDTRRTRALLSAAGIAAPRLEAVHTHNEAAGAQRAVDLARRGGTVVVVSDAGMPGVSDPGERVVRAAVDAGVPVSTVPGPTAAVSALVLSGLDTGRWCFEGFLPRKGALRADRLAALAGEGRTSVLYEAPHRVARTLADLAAACGPQRPVAVARELTKLHEELWRGTLEGAVAKVAEDPPRGEWVIVVGGAPATEVTDDAVRDRIADLLAAGADRRDAVAEVTAELGVARRRAYDLALGLRNDGREPGGR
jgi:16S rRNA (cytidine1402-2'-O)-methyltransferase